MSEYRKGYVYIQNHYAGIIEETEDGYAFSYHPDYLRLPEAVAASLTLPLRTEPYETSILFPFFDGLIPVNIIVPQDQEQLALTLNGKKRNIRKKDFRMFAETCGIPQKAADHMLTKLCFFEDKLIAQTQTSYLPTEQKDQVCELIIHRIAQLQ